MDLTKRNNTNRLNGSGFEAILERQARARGLLAVKMGLSARMIGFKKVLAVKSHLDFEIVRRDGRVAKIDAKCYSDSFRYSEIRPHQLEKALLYESWGIPAGLVVWFRKPDQVSYFSARTLARIGPGHSFRPGQGLALGHLSSFDLGLIFKAEEPVKLSVGLSSFGR